MRSTTARGIRGAVVLGCVSCGAFGLAASSAHAAIIEFSFSGEIIDIQDPDDLFPAQFGIGDAFSASFQFDMSTPASAFPAGYPTPDGSYYSGAILDYSAVIDGIPIGPSDIPIGADSGIQVQNDLIGADGMAALIGDLATGILAASFIDFDQTLFTNEDLPETLDFSNVDIAVFQYVLGSFGSADAGLAGQILTFSSRIVPAPGVLAIAPVGMVCSMRRRRR